MRRSPGAPDRGRGRSVAPPCRDALRPRRPHGFGSRDRRRLRPRSRRPGHPPAPQDRGLSKDPALPADRPRRGLHAGGRLMARRIVARLVGPRVLKRWLPKTLWGRSFLIIVLPV